MIKTIQIMKLTRVLLVVFSLNTLTLFSQVNPVSFQKVFTTNALSNTVSIGENSEFTFYQNKIYVADHDSSGLLFLHKLDIGGNLIWSKRYQFLPAPPAMNIEGFGGNVFLINEASQGMSAQFIIKIDTSSGAIVDTTIFNPCPPATNRTKNKNHVILDNGLIVTYACKTGSGRPCLFVTNAVSGDLISANEFIEPSILGTLYDARITKLTGNSILLYGRGSNGLYYFSKITNPITLANTGLHVLKQNPALGGMVVESATEYNGSTNKIFMLYRFNGANTTNVVIQSDTSLNEFKAYKYGAGNYFSSAILQSNNKLYLGAYSMNVFASSGNYLVSVFDLNLNHQQTNQFSAVPFNTLQVIPYRALSLTSDNNSKVYTAFDTRSIATASNNNLLHLYKLNTNAESICSTPFGSAPNFTLSNLQDSLVATLTTTTGLLPFKSSYTITAQNSSITGSMSCIISNLTDKTSNAFNTCVYPNPAKNELTVRSQISNGYIIITDVLGKIVLNENINSNRTTFNVERLENGCYILKLIDGSNSMIKTEKLIIDK